jgi:hypothetical protein
MIEIVDTSPEVDVQPAEYLRLLGYPRDFIVRDRARELVEWARAWYAEHGRPWVFAREIDTMTVVGEGLTLNGVSFASAPLSKTLRHADAHGAVVVAVSAGPELEREAQKLWSDGKPDEYFFLEVFGSAVVEHLVTMTGARLCSWAETRRLAILPHYSPGYPEWAIGEQPRLLEVVNSLRSPQQSTVAVEVLDSGMLRPKKSLLAVFGVTRHVDRVKPLTDLIACEHCSFLPCQYRRSPYRRAPQPVNPELSTRGESSNMESSPAGPLDRGARYSIHTKALTRWSEERLSLARRGDGSVDAVFCYEGTTCTNMGRPLQFQYRVTLGPRQDGYPIREQRCAPSDGDDGYTFMCRYLIDREDLLTAIGRERPLTGRPLNDVLAWTRPVSAAGCYCEPESRQHKWGLVLETIHFALARAEGK